MYGYAGANILLPDNDPKSRTSKQENKNAEPFCMANL
jgi:hypothetical protein